jgi:sugar transferase (PEP-CTERM system associated)
MNVTPRHASAPVLPVLVEAALLSGAVLALAWLTGEINIPGNATRTAGIDQPVILLAATVLGVGAPSMRWAADRWGHRAMTVALAALPAGVICAIAAVLHHTLVGSDRLTTTIVLAEAAVVTPLVLVGWRFAADKLRLRGFVPERLLVVGSGAGALQVATLARAMSDGHWSRYELLGFVDVNGRGSDPKLGRIAPVLRGEDLLATLDPSSVDRVVLALQERRGTLPVQSLLRLRTRGVCVEESGSFLERHTGQIGVERLRPSALLLADGFHTSPGRKLRKRLFDVAAATGLLVVTAPVMVLAALAIRLDSRGPVLYRQRRVGRDGAEFVILKFRSMIEDAERSGPAWAGERDPRVTRVGRVLRKTRIDELPQLFNVLRGDMSFVGPRPERPYFVEQLAEKIPYYTLREVCRPGITGWAQVSYRYGSSEKDALEKLKYDLYYIKKAGALLDVWIMLKTVRVVLGGDGR